MFTRSCQTELFLWKILRSASLGIHTELQMRGWKKKEVMKDLAHFQFVSLTTCERTQTVHGLQEKTQDGCRPGSLAKPRARRGCGELGSRTGRWWQLQLSCMACEPRGQALATAWAVPCGLFFKSEDGGIWSTTGEVALQGEAVNCQLSQP